MTNEATMKAATFSKYGPAEVLSVKALEKPVPKDNEVLIEVHASTVTSGDFRVRSFNLPRGFGLIGR